MYFVELGMGIWCVEKKVLVLQIDVDLYLIYFLEFVFFFIKQGYKKVRLFIIQFCEVQKDYVKFLGKSLVY